MNCEREFLTQRAVRPWHSCPEKLRVRIPAGAPGRVGQGPAPTWPAGWQRSHGRHLGLGGLYDPFLSVSSHI